MVTVRLTVPPSQTWGINVDCFKYWMHSLNESNGRICKSDPPEMFVGKALACTSTGDNPADYSFFWLVFTYLASCRLVWFCRLCVLWSTNQHQINMSAWNAQTHLSHWTVWKQAVSSCWQLNVIFGWCISKSSAEAANPNNQQLLAWRQQGRTSECLRGSSVKSGSLLSSSCCCSTAAAWASGITRPFRLCRVGQETRCRVTAVDRRRVPVQNGITGR